MNYNDESLGPKQFCEKQETVLRLEVMSLIEQVNLINLEEIVTRPTLGTTEEEAPTKAAITAEVVLLVDTEEIMDHPVEVSHTRHRLHSLDLEVQVEVQMIEIEDHHSLSRTLARRNRRAQRDYIASIKSPVVCSPTPKTPMTALAEHSTCGLLYTMIV